MQDSEERWKRLCEEAATEQDAQKLIDLVGEINDLLELIGPPILNTH